MVDISKQFSLYTQYYAQKITYVSTQFYKSLTLKILCMLVQYQNSVWVPKHLQQGIQWLVTRSCHKVSTNHIRAHRILTWCSQWGTSRGICLNNPHNNHLTRFLGRCLVFWWPYIVKFYSEFCPIGCIMLGFCVLWYDWLKPCGMIWLPAIGSPVVDAWGPIL
jgi:hypothetical protein